MTILFSRIPRAIGAQTNVSPLSSPIEYFKPTCTAIKRALARGQFLNPLSKHRVQVPNLSKSLR